MHLNKKIAAPLAVAGLVAAAPSAQSEASINARANGQFDDATILNYALTLEHLEAAFYKSGLQMFNAGAFEDAKFPPWVRERFTEIANHEETHVDFLTEALKAAGTTPVQACTYEFGVTSPRAFLATAQILEGVGVAAYLGAAPSIANKAFLAAAGSILVVEAQHETWLKSAADTQDGFPRPFAAGLDFDQVFSLAAPFIKNCPESNPPLPFTSFPALTATIEGAPQPGAKVHFKSATEVGATFAAFVSATNTQFMPINGGEGTIVIPEGIRGQSYLILTKSESVSDEATVAGPALLDVPLPNRVFSY